MVLANHLLLSLLRLSLLKILFVASQRPFFLYADASRKIIGALQ
jgi:hypothetical protein